MKKIHKKKQFKQKTLAVNNTKREDHGITTEEKSEIVFFPASNSIHRYRRG